MVDHREGSTLHGAMTAKHEWTAPPPGAGTLPVCLHCGQRAAGYIKDAPCRRNNGPTDPQPVTDYDPIQ